MSIFRNTVWYIQGLNHYTKAGYESAAKKFIPNEMEEADVKSKRVMVTGANSGIGLACATVLAKKGAEVHLVCRNPERGQKCMSDLKESCANENIHLHLADMSNLKQVADMATAYESGVGKLDVLIANAGGMNNEKVLDESTGLEMNFVTNTLGTFLLVEKMIPALQKSDDPRVIVVSSGGMLVQKLNYEDPSLAQDKSTFDGVMTYAQNKRQQVVLCELWAKKYAGVHFSSMHPGWSDTPGVSTAMPSFYESMKGKLRTTEQGADTAVWLACTKRLKDFESGAFFQDREPVAKHLPFAWTTVTDENCETFYQKLCKMASSFL